jgi:predicted membrane-bound dolichyl-phosphate-mannose-protein mannosyltransferase
VMRKHGQATSARSLVPGGFVGSLLVLAPLAIWVPAAMILLDVELAFYVAVALAFAVICLRRRRLPWRMLPRVLAVFPTVHVAHGLGMLAGWLRAAVAGRAR